MADPSWRFFLEAGLISFKNSLILGIGWEPEYGFPVELIAKTRSSMPGWAKPMLHSKSWIVELICLKRRRSRQRAEGENVKMDMGVVNYW